VNSGKQGMYLPISVLNNVQQNTLTGNNPNRILIRQSWLGVQLGG